MNTPGLFIVGAVVTLVVVAAIAILIYGAVLDGRDQREEGDQPAHPRGSESVTSPPEVHWEPASRRAGSRILTRPSGQPRSPRDIDHEPRAWACEDERGPANRSRRSARS